MLVRQMEARNIHVSRYATWSMLTDSYIFPDQFKETESLMRELHSVMEFKSNIHLNEITDYNNSIGEQFGEFKFLCGCQEIHSINKIISKNPLTPTVWGAGNDLSTYLNSGVKPVFAEKNRILFFCRKGFFTMISRSKTLLKTTINSDFFIRQDIIDADQNGFGLFIQTNSFNFDFNVYRRNEFPTKILANWSELESQLLNQKVHNIEAIDSYHSDLDDVYYRCPCDGQKHNMRAHRSDLEFNQSVGGFHVAVLMTVTSEGARFLTLCSNGFYCYVQVRPTLPVEWFFKCETVKIEDRGSAPILPSEFENSALPSNIIEHIKFTHAKARNFY